MNERVYKTMGRTGTAAIVLGIISMSVGVVCGILSIIFGARLLKRKSEVLI
ncbi:MAG: hypothetical protein KA953_06180 [Lachnospiraceae bacterium]|jgi:hypothetical protein|nr:hypothetical protein [Lachnospiraceae bacterium]